MSTPCAKVQVCELLESPEVCKYEYVCMCLPAHMVKCWPAGRLK